MPEDQSPPSDDDIVSRLMALEPEEQDDPAPEDQSEPPEPEEEPDAEADESEEGDTEPEADDDAEDERISNCNTTALQRRCRRIVQRL